MATRRLTDAEMVAELERAVANDGADGFYTTEQWAAKMGREAQAVRKRIKAGIAAGVVQVKRIPGIDHRGIACVNTVYRFLSAKDSAA